MIPFSRKNLINVLNSLIDLDSWHKGVIDINEDSVKESEHGEDEPGE